MYLLDDFENGNNTRNFSSNYFENDFSPPLTTVESDHPIFKSRFFALRHSNENSEFKKLVQTDAEKFGLILLWLL